MLKILWKMGEIAPEEQFFPLTTIFYYLMLDFCVKTGIRFSLRDKRLFEITEVEITRVDCILSHNLARGTTDDFATVPFHHLFLFSVPLVKLPKSIPVHSLRFLSHLLYCLPFLVFPFAVPCRIIFAKTRRP